MHILLTYGHTHTHTHIFALHKCKTYSKLVVGSILLHLQTSAEFLWFSVFGRWNVNPSVNQNEKKSVLLLAKRRMNGKKITVKHKRPTEKEEYAIRIRLNTTYYTCLIRIQTQKKCFWSHKLFVLAANRKSSNGMHSTKEFSTLSRWRHSLSISQSSGAKRIGLATLLQMNLFAESVCLFSPHFNLQSPNHFAHRMMLHFYKS